MKIGISVVLCPVVYFTTIIHELGHYLPRKLFGIKTNVFIGPWDSEFFRVGDWWFSRPSSSRLGGGANFPGSFEVFDSWKYVVILLGAAAFNVLTAVVVVLVGVWTWHVFPSAHNVPDAFLLSVAFGLVCLWNVFNLHNLRAHTDKEGKWVAAWVLERRDHAEDEIIVSDGTWIKLHFYAKHHPDEREKINVLLDDRGEEADRFRKLVEGREREGIRWG